MVMKDILAAVLLGWPVGNLQDAQHAGVKHHPYSSILAWLRLTLSAIATWMAHSPGQPLPAWSLAVDILPVAYHHHYKRPLLRHVLKNGSRCGCV
ncbi:hypothetical protein HaLaN_12865 [Haematococcus lacustris]|uniref:Uncharacterized protein n=1 Tax=Haematococcus lacustris TaxID=44745 RepID=A0A699Z1N2_HAELA|nr:hypothetical protein HaLaN_12865 [Haematococcus lacustris]